MDSSKYFAHISVSKKLVNLIEDNAHELTIRCIDNLLEHQYTKTYCTYDEDKLHERVYRVYSQLGKWISRKTTKEEIAEHYTALGAQRKREGFKASEVIQALIIIRRHLWLKILAEGFIDNVLELNQALALNNRVILFFDRAIHYTIKGYEEAE
ncbi:MAG TPA: hypothetical protein ENL46_01765 [Candidatus Aminicenantes bacterium]|nr:hypothetical protein [Candidatus Aminicenantes bacterium]